MRRETRDTKSNTRNVKQETTQNNKKSKILKSLNRFWVKAQFWKPTKYQDLLGFRENNSRLYDIAFIHSSMSQRDKKGRVVNNERLEFLGDAVLETVMSEMVYKHYPSQKEGWLSSVRALLVRRKTTNELGENPLRTTFQKHLRWIRNFD